MFSVIFPGQGSQSVGMVKNLYDKHYYIKDLFDKADQILGFSITKMIFEGPIEELNKTENTQPAIFLASYAIYEFLKRESEFKVKNVKYFAGHSLGEYSALAATDSIDFEQAIKLLKARGRAMQLAVPDQKGGMLAVLGSEIDIISKILDENSKKYECYIANDNSNGQIVISGMNKDLNLLIEDLKIKSIKNVKLSVSAPFHCKLMNPATEIMKKEISASIFKKPTNAIISNVTAKETIDPDEIKKLLIKQIESPVRWRESVLYMIKSGTKQFIEIGPGKVLSGLIKRIDRSISLVSVNTLEDIQNLKI